MYSLQFISKNRQPHIMFGGIDKEKKAVIKIYI